MLKFYNGTPHEIHIVRNGVFEPQIRKYVLPEGRGLDIIVSLPSNAVLSAKIEKVETASLDGIPVQSQKVTGIDPLPEGYDAYIVSAIYAVAARQLGMETSKMYVIADPVFSTDGRTVLGCRALAPAL